MQHKRFWNIVVWCFLLTLAVPAMAQSADAPRAWMSVLVSARSLIWLGLAAVFCYLLSCVLASSFVKTQYPPDAARLCIWLGMLAWAVYVIFVQPRYVVHMALPLWFDLALLVVILLFGAALMFTRRPAA